MTRAKKQNSVLMSEKRMIQDKYGIERLVNFISIFKIVEEKLKKNRLFFKDFTGSIVEVPQKKVYVRTKDLKHIKRMANAGSVSVYGEHNMEIGFLCKNTNAFIRGHRAIGALKTYEENEKAAQEAQEEAELENQLEAIGGQLIKDEEPASRNDEPSLMKRSTLMRKNTVVRDPLNSFDGEAINPGMRQRNLSMAQKPKESGL